MPNISLHCPHCLDRQTNFYIVNLTTDTEDVGDAREFRGAALCASCRQHVAFVAHPAAGRTIFDVMQMARTPMVSISKLIVIEQLWPEAPKPNVPDYLPADVESMMLEAEEVRLGKNFRSARATYRTVLDIATKELCPTRRGKRLRLIDRIDRLAKEHRITPALAEWAHAVRAITNESAHTAELVSREEAAEVAEITRMMLVYLFELPERVRLASKKRTANGPAAIATDGTAPLALPAPTEG